MGGVRRVRQDTEGAGLHREEFPNHGAAVHRRGLRTRLRDRGDTEGEWGPEPVVGGPVCMGQGAGHDPRVVVVR